MRRFGFYQSCRNRGSVGTCVCVAVVWVAWARDGVMSVCVVSLDCLCRWNVHVSVYRARRIPTHLGAPSVQPCCTLLILASYRVFIVAHIANPGLMWLSDQDLSLYRPLL